VRTDGVAVNSSKVKDLVRSLTCLVTFLLKKVTECTAVPTAKGSVWM
jgi:hypothetical protein